MRLELTGRHVEIVPTIRRLVDRKLAKLERLLDHRALSAQVVLTQGKRLLTADVTLHARGERFLHGRGEAAAWDAAIQQATEKIEQQALKLKGKWEDRKRGGRDLVPMEPEAAPPAPKPSPKPLRTPLQRPRVLRTTRQAIRTLSVADATRRLDSGNGGPLVFREAETDELNILYRDADGELVLVVAVG